MARKVAGKSQWEAADHVKVTFQQYQKWEKGANRTPARELKLLASFFGTPLSELMGADDHAPAQSPLRVLLERLPDKEFQQALKAWSDIEDPRIKSVIVDFINALAALSS
jgi:transcriptional regulator with XRE-family HTH domain